MTTINLRDFYPFYTHDEFVEVPEVIAAELIADRRYEQSHARRMRRNKATYSLDEDNGIEAATPICYNDSPERIFDLMEQHCRLCRALNSLPEIQGRRIEAHYLLGMSQRQIAEIEGVSLNSVSISLRKGLQAMRNFLKNF